MASLEKRHVFLSKSREPFRWSRKGREGKGVNEVDKVRNTMACIAKYFLIDTWEDMKSSRTI